MSNNKPCNLQINGLPYVFEIHPQDDEQDQKVKKMAEEAIRNLDEFLSETESHLNELKTKINEAIHGSEHDISKSEIAGGSPSGLIIRAKDPSSEYEIFLVYYAGNLIGASTSLVGANAILNSENLMNILNSSAIIRDLLLELEANNENEPG